MVTWRRAIWKRIVLVAAAGAYVLTWTNALTAATAWFQGGTPLSFGESASGTLDDKTFRQIYTFEGNADEVITVTMSRIEGDLDPYLLLTDEQGTILAFSDDDGPGMDARIESKRIPASGRYFVIATRFGQEHGSTTGTYTLLLERVSVLVSETTTLQYGSSVVGRITPEEPLVFYFLRAQRGDVITISMHRTSGNLDPHLDLAQSNGLILVSNDDDPLVEGTLDAGINRYTVLKTGVYLIVATRFGREVGNTKGSYVLSVSQVAPDELGLTPGDARLIDYGLPLDGTIDNDVPVRYYRFDGRRGDVIAVMMTAQSGNLDPLVKLADANLAVITQDDDSGGGKDARIAAYSLPAAGTYYLLATRAGEQAGQTSGTYTLELAGRAGVAGDQALEIVYGATVSGLIGGQTNSERYVFLGQQGDIIRITMERASGDLNVLITLLDSDGKQIAFDDAGGGGQVATLSGFVLPRAGMFMIVASRLGRETGTTTGAYILKLELMRPGSPG
jgi:hypothetical protein